MGVLWLRIGIGQIVLVGTMLRPAVKGLRAPPLPARSASHLSG
jgi:hypothetical protein